MKLSFSRSTILVAALLSLAATGCEDEVDYIPPVGGSPPGGAAVPAATAAPKRPGVQDDLGPPPPMRDFQEADFAETERSRDPFRGFESLFVSQAKGRVTLQRNVLIDMYAVNELRLVGIVSRSQGRALLIDPTGLGWVVKVGDFIGKAEVVNSGGPTGTDVAINWRIDRIREGDIVLVREDPSHPEIPPTTRAIALRSDEDKN